MSANASTTNPLWNVFLDSESTNATFFLRLQVPQSYFHSPTPWNPGNRNGQFSQKVSSLLDSFRPGSYSYNPFCSTLDDNSNNNNEITNDNQTNNDNHRQDNLNNNQSRDNLNDNNQRNRNLNQSEFNTNDNNFTQSDPISERNITSETDPRSATTESNHVSITESNPKSSNNEESSTEQNSNSLQEQQTSDSNSFEETDNRPQNIQPDTTQINNTNNQQYSNLSLDDSQLQNHESTTNEVLTISNFSTNRRLPSLKSANHNLNLNNLSANRNQYLNNTANEELSHEETNRRRLYLNLGRPRPFYREQMTSPSSETDTSQLDNRQTTNRNIRPKVKKEVLSLQHLVRKHLVKSLGIGKLWKIVRHNLHLPGVVSDFLLTCSCQEFEVKRISGTKCASYTVRSMLDGELYTAVFATSDADKAVSNLWEETSDWIYLDQPGVISILAIAVDTLTQNIFYIIRGDLTPLNEHIKINLHKREEILTKFESSINQTMEQLRSQNLLLKRLQLENIFVSSQGEFLIENDLLIKPKPYFCSEHSLNTDVIKDEKDSSTPNNILKEADDLESFKTVLNDIIKRYF